MAMERLILQNVEDLQRIRMLKDNAHRVLENHEYDYVLTGDEIIDEEHEHALAYIEITKLEEEKAEIMTELNDSLKRKKEAAAIILEKIRSGRSRVTETCYVMEDDETGYQGVYNRHGQLISEIAPRPGQTKSLFRIKAGDDEDAYTRKVG